MSKKVNTMTGSYATYTIENVISYREENTSLKTGTFCFPDFCY